MSEGAVGAKKAESKLGYMKKLLASGTEYKAIIKKFMDRFPRVPVSLAYSLRWVAKTALSKPSRRGKLDVAKKSAKSEPAKAAKSVAPAPKSVKGKAATVAPKVASTAKGAGADDDLF